MRGTWFSTLLGLVVLGCHGGTNHHAGDAGPGDASSGSDAGDGSVAASCTSIQPWCDGAFCLQIPAAPSRQLATVTANFTPLALGGAGEVWFATERPNTLGHITTTSGLEMVVLPPDPAAGSNAATNVDAMTAVSPTDVYACGQAGAWHYDGQQWSLLDSWLPGFNCDELWAAGADDFWLVDQGELRRRLNGTWSSYSGLDTVYAIDGQSPSDVWFGGARGYVAHWDGTQYQVLIGASSDSDVPDIDHVAELGPSDIAAGQNRIINGTVMTSTQLGYPAEPDVTWGTSDDFWIESTPSQTGRTLWHHAGGTWTQFPSPDETVRIAGTGPSDVWFIYEHSTEHWNGQSMDSCASWGSAASAGGKVRGTASDYSDLWVLQPNGPLTHSVNGGAFAVVPTTYGNPGGFDARGGAGVFAVGGVGDGTVDGIRPIAQAYDGTSWTDITCPHTQGADQLLHAAKIVAANDVWFAGDGGTVYHWDGSACTLVTHPLATTTYRVIEATGPDDVWVFGDTATLHWDGTALARSAQTIAAIDAISAGTSVWVVGGGDVQQWNGTTWTSRGAGSGVTAGGSIWASGAGDVWVVTDRGALVHFDGSAWTTVPVSPIVGAGSGPGTGIWGNGTAGDFVLSWGGGIVRHP